MIKEGRFNRIVYSDGMTVEVGKIDGKHVITLGHPSFKVECPYIGIDLNEIRSFLGGNIRGMYDTEPNRPAYIRIVRGTYDNKDDRFGFGEVIINILLMNQTTGDQWDYTLTEANAKSLCDMMQGKRPKPEDGQMTYRISTGTITVDGRHRRIILDEAYRKTK